MAAEAECLKLALFGATGTLHLGMAAVGRSENSVIPAMSCVPPESLYIKKHYLNKDFNKTVS